MVLFIDYWTRAIDRYVAPIAALLADSGLSVELLHMGSTRGESTTYRQPVLGIPSTDYSHFNRDLEAGILHFKPDAVVVLNNAHLVDRLIHRICRRAHIPTVFMMHGIPAVDASRLEQVRNYRAHLGWRTRIRKGLRRWPEVRQYLAAVARDGDLLDPGTIRFLLDQLVSPARTWDFPRRTHDLRSDYLLAWSRRHAQFYEEVFGYRPEDITVIGAPTHDEAVRLAAPEAADERERLRRELGIPGDLPVCLVVLDSLSVADGTWNEGDVVAEVRAIATAAAAAGAHTVVKPHPSSPGTAATARAMSAGLSVTVVENVDVGRLTTLASIVFGHVSSALAIAILLDRPLVIPKWGPVFRSFDYYVADRAAIAVREVAELGEVIDHLLSHRGRWIELSESVKTYRADHVTFTDGKSTQRAACRIRQIATMHPNTARTHP